MINNNAMIFIIVVVVILVTSLILFYIWFKYRYRYWKNINVPGPKPAVPFGIFSDVFLKGRHFVEPVTELYEKYKYSSYFGIFILHRPALVLRDLDLIKNVFVKDYEYFNSRGFVADAEYDPLSIHLFALKGPEWRNMRRKLSPAFSSGRIKLMFTIMIEIAQAFEHYLTDLYEQNEIIDIKKMFDHYNMSVIANCAFGIESDTMNGRQNEFKRICHEAVVPPTFQRKLSMIMQLLLPDLMVQLNLELWSKESFSFFKTIITETVAQREKKGIKRYDFLERLIELNKIYNADIDSNVKDNENGLTLNEMVAQSFFFMLAGYESSASLQTFTLYEIARNSDVQKKTRENIIKSLQNHNGHCSYDCLKEMNYLEMVMDETLRKYPALGVLTRECIKSYKLENNGPVIQKGTLVMVPLLGIHMDPNIYPDPDKFEPERFLPEKKSSRHFSTYMPFGGGPRMCMGKRFATIQTRLAIVKILTKYEVEFCNKTPEKIVLSPNSLTTTHKDDLPIKLRPLKYTIPIKF